MDYRIEVGKKKDSTLYVAEDGHSYTKSRSGKTGIFLRCWFRASKLCRGSASIKFQNHSKEILGPLLTPGQGHSHDPDFDMNIKSRLRRKLVEAAVREAMTVKGESLRQLFKDICSEDPNGHLLEYEEVDSLMYRARKQERLRLQDPHSVPSFHDIHFGDDEWYDCDDLKTSVGNPGDSSDIKEEESGLGRDVKVEESREQRETDKADTDADEDPEVCLEDERKEICLNTWSVFLEKSLNGTKDMPFQLLLNMTETIIQEMRKIVESCLIELEPQDSKVPFDISVDLANILKCSSNDMIYRSEIPEQYRRLFTNVIQTEAPNETWRIEFGKKGEEYSCLQKDCSGLDPFITFLDLASHHNQNHMDEDKNHRQFWRKRRVVATEQHGLDPPNDISKEKGNEEDNFDHTKVDMLKIEIEGDTDFSSDDLDIDDDLDFNWGDEVSQKREKNKLYSKSVNEKKPPFKFQSSKPKPEIPEFVKESAKNDNPTLSTSGPKPIGQPTSCEECGKTFASKCLLRQHMDVHIKGTNHMCETCGKGFKVKKYLTSHIQTVHANVEYKCDQCEKSFRQKGTLREHKKYKHSLTPPTRMLCEICEKDFATKISLKAHQVLLHKVNGGNLEPVVCPECPAQFLARSRLQEHVLTKHRGIRLPCPYCEKQFNQKDSLMKHQALAHGKGNRELFRCESCPAVYSSNHNLKVHINAKHLGIRYSCPNCSREYCRKNKMVAHLKKGKCGPTTS